MLGKQPHPHSVLVHPGAALGRSIPVALFYTLLMMTGIETGTGSWSCLLQTTPYFAGTMWVEGKDFISFGK